MPVQQIFLITLQIGMGQVKKVQALFETGAQANLINEELIPQGCKERARDHLFFFVGNWVVGSNYVFLLSRRWGRKWESTSRHTPHPVFRFPRREALAAGRAAFPHLCGSPMDRPPSLRREEARWRRGIRPWEGRRRRLPPQQLWFGYPFLPASCPLHPQVARWRRRNFGRTGPERSGPIRT